MLTQDTANSQIYFGTPTDAFGAFLRWDYTNRNLILSTANGTGKLIFQTGLNVEAARIDQSGNMGIGLTGATQKLEVSGNTLIYGTLSATTISATTYQNLPNSLTGIYLPTSGGTVSGNTIFTSGLTANTISANTLTITNNIDSSNRILFDSASNYSLSWDSRTLTDNTNTSSVEWQSRGLYDSNAGSLSVDWENRSLSDNTAVESLSWQGRDLIDSSNNQSINWENRVIYNSSGVPVIDWENLNLNDASGVTILDWNNKILTGMTNMRSSTISATTISATTLVLSGSQIETAWTSYVPVWTASSSNPVIGNGTIEGYYKLIGKTCFVRGNVVMGSTTTFGSGEWYVSMPFTAVNADTILMTANLLDNGSAWYNATLNGARSGFNNRAPIQYQSTGGTANDVNSTQPFTWATSDRFIWNGSYEIA
jgi:hypothetical protein